MEKPIAKPIEEPEVRRAKLAKRLEEIRAVGRAEGLSDELITQANNDVLRAFDYARQWENIFDTMFRGAK